MNRHNVIPRLLAYNRVLNAAFYAALARDDQGRMDLLIVRIRRVSAALADKIAV